MPTTPFALDMDLPSGELVVGQDWEALAPLPMGSRRYSLNRPDTRARDTEVLAKEHLFALYGSGEFTLELRQHIKRGSLVVQVMGTAMPKDHVTLAVLDSHTLHFMDGADYDAQTKALGSVGNLLARVPLEPGRWRFEVNHERLFSFQHEIPPSYRWCQAKRVGPASPIVRAAPPVYAAHPEKLTDTGMGQFLMTHFARQCLLFPHPAQVAVDVLTTYGGPFAWKNGLITDQAVTQPDPPAWKQGLLPCEPPVGVIVPTFPALASLGPASVDQVTARDNQFRSVALNAPLNADRHWLALALIVFASLRAAPEVAAAPDPNDDARVVAEIDLGFRQLCGLVTQTQRWDEVTQAMTLLSNLIDVFGVPAPRFSARQQALAQIRQESEGQPGVAPPDRSNSPHDIPVARRRRAP